MVYIKLKNILFSKNIIVGYLYFYVHFITEVICFFVLKRVVGDSIVLWVSPVLFDMLAFVPQSLIGYVNDLHPKIKSGVIGSILMIVGVIDFTTGIIGLKYSAIVIIGIANAFLHVAGAEATLKSSNGMMSNAAIFVSGGSFGVVTGKILGASNMPMNLLIILALTMIPFSLLADSYVDYSDKNPCKNYNYANKNVSPLIIVLLATFVVIIRGYMGYGIPTSWNKTLFQTILLFCFMGIGKALGGILIDLIGMKKTAIFSVIAALPFLIVGDNLMVVSLIGVLFFSMTMAVTLGLLVSVLKNKPGLAFGYTTIGLFLGSIPIFFFRITSTIVNIGIILILSILCIFALNLIISKDGGVND